MENYWSLLQYMLNMKMCTPVYGGFGNLCYLKCLLGVACFELRRMETTCHVFYPSDGVA